jgi:hypothetical protein
MLQRIFSLLTLVIAVAVFAVSAAEPIYRDPQRRFTLLVPNGWTTKPSVGGVNILHDKAFASLIVLDGGGDPQRLLTFLGSQFEN